ncbi:MAG TPA: hypothetical protein VEI04_02660 [Syntrophobacteria bacterium]|nr:hypothetical protein [Syntrophobacteria bacterium]
MEAGINHSDFLEHLAGHPATTRRVQRYFYEQIRHQMPTASEKEVLRQLIMSRLTALVEQGSDLFGLTAIGNEEAKFMARIDQIVSQHNNIESLIDVMTEDEARRELAIPPSPEYEDAARRVSEILAKS